MTATQFKQSTTDRSNPPRKRAGGKQWDVTYSDSILRWLCRGTLYSGKRERNQDRRTATQEVMCDRVKVCDVLYLILTYTVKSKYTLKKSIGHLLLLTLNRVTPGNLGQGFSESLANWTRHRGPIKLAWTWKVMYAITEFEWRIVKSPSAGIVFQGQ